MISVRTTCFAAILVVTVGCSKPVPDHAGESRVTGGETPDGSIPHFVKLSNGLRYRVDRAGKFDALPLPQNSDLKMADGDLAKYGVTACSLDVSAQNAPDRCDVYVQPDRSGTLIGYAFVTRNAKGARFETVTTLNDQKQPGGGNCSLGGTIYDYASGGDKAVADPSKDFLGRQMYNFFKNGAGHDLVSEVDPNSSDESTGLLGVWYITKEGEKLRINQERWNYCYKDENVTVDDVFYRAVSLEKVSPQ